MNSVKQAYMDWLTDIKELNDTYATDFSRIIKVAEQSIEKGEFGTVGNLLGDLQIHFHRIDPSLQI